MGPSELMVIVLLGACGAAAWRMGEAKGINPWLCAACGAMFGPFFLIFLIFVPDRDGVVPDLRQAPDEPHAPEPPRETVYASPPPPRFNG